MSYTTHFLTNIYNLYFAQHQKILPPSKLCKQSFFQNNIFDILIKLTFIFFIQNMSVLKKKHLFVHKLKFVLTGFNMAHKSRFSKSYF